MKGQQNLVATDDEETDVVHPHMGIAGTHVLIGLIHALGLVFPDHIHLHNKK